MVVEGIQGVTESKQIWLFFYTQRSVGGVGAPIINNKSGYKSYRSARRSKNDPLAIDELFCLPLAK